MVWCAKGCNWCVEAPCHKVVFMTALRTASIENIVEVGVRDMELGWRDSHYRPYRVINIGDKRVKCNSETHHISDASVPDATVSVHL